MESEDILKTLEELAKAGAIKKVDSGYLVKDPDLLPEGFIEKMQEVAAKAKGMDLTGAQITAVSVKIKS